ncbi:lipopolysaccharide biosynthesis protein [Micromonospora sp. CPCC 206061]|uniref:lipopolysaccharide biosynthesis protein n=1 Tax=Micromonospora sp. CPCC 206061 TaxID=3122410 RepID=UPI002FF2A8B1
MSLKVAEDASLFSKAGRALGWSFASTAFGRLSTLVIGVALARILGPEAFGTFAVAMVALLAVLSFNELGVSLAIVRWPGEPREIAPTVATVSVVASCLVYIACFFGAPFFASAMGDPTATPVIRVLALSVIVSGFVATPVALLQRGFRQDRKTVADLTTNWGSALTSIGCAVGGLGAMSLAVGQLTGAVAGAILFFRFAPEGLRFGFDRRKARELLRFGLPLAGSSIVVFAATNVDRLMVGALLGPVALGYYVLAVNLANWPISIFSQPVRAVAPAALARLQSDQPAMRTAFLSTAGLLASVTLPACVLLAAVADPLIRFVYGGVWQPSAPVLVWLAVLAAARIVFELIYDYFVVIANTRVVFTVQVIWLVALVPALWVGATAGGLWGAGAAQVGVALLIVLPIYLFEMRRVGIPPGAFTWRLALPVAGALAVAAVAAVAGRLSSIDLVVLAIAGFAALATIALLGYRMRGVLRSLRTVGATAE